MIARAAADEITERNAGQDGVRKRVAKKCHAAQDNKCANYRAYNADKHSRNHSALHEFIGEGFEEERHSILDLRLIVVDCETVVTTLVVPMKSD